MSRSQGETNRSVRQENLRDWLSKKCTAQHLIDNLDKIEKLDSKSELFTNDLAKYKVANEQRLKILSKYLPDLKSTEITGEGGEPLKAHIISDKPMTTEEWEKAHADNMESTIGTATSAD